MPAAGGHHALCLGDDVIDTHDEPARLRPDRGVLVDAELDRPGAADQPALAAEQARLLVGEALVQVREPLVERAPARSTQGDEPQDAIGGARHHYRSYSNGRTTCQTKVES